ncbi:hypothetical protein BIW11_13882, partial [Tropilaelaps mercedesae]
MPLWNSHFVRYALYGFVLLKNGLREDTRIEGVERMIFAPPHVADDPPETTPCPATVDPLLAELIGLCLCNIFATILWSLCRRCRRRTHGQRPRVAHRTTFVTTTFENPTLFQRAPVGGGGLGRASICPPADKGARQRRRRRLRRSPPALPPHTDDEPPTDVENETNSDSKWTLVSKKKKTKPKSKPNSTEQRAAGFRSSGTVENDVVDGANPETGRPIPANLAREPVDSGLESLGVAPAGEVSGLSELGEPERSVRLFHGGGHESHRIDERDAIQKKTFTKWVNKHLAKQTPGGPPRRRDDRLVAGSRMLGRTRRQKDKDSVSCSAAFDTNTSITITKNIITFPTSFSLRSKFYSARAGNSKRAQRPNAGPQHRDGESTIERQPCREPRPSICTAKNRTMLFSTETSGPAEGGWGPPRTCQLQSGNNLLAVNRQRLQAMQPARALSLYAHLGPSRSTTANVFANAFRGRERGPFYLDDLEFRRIRQQEASRRVDDLFEDLKDGHSLLSLLEVLSGEYLPREKGRMRFHQLQNVESVLNFLRAKNVKTVNIRPEDIVDGNPKLTLGLIWTIILHFQVSSGSLGVFSAKHLLRLFKHFINNT